MIVAIGQWDRCLRSEATDQKRGDKSSCGSKEHFVIRDKKLSTKPRMEEKNDDALYVLLSY